MRIDSGTNANIKLRTESRRPASDPELRRRRQASRRGQRIAQRHRESNRPVHIDPAEIVPGNSMFPWFKLLFRRGIDLRSKDDTLRRAGH